MSGVTQSVEFNASMEDSFNTICDFASYPDFLETIKKAKILEQDSKRAVVAFQVELFKTFDYTIEMQMKNPSELTWSLVEADMMKKNDGSWKLKKIADNRTLAEYSVDIDFGIWVPGPIKKFLIESSIPQTLNSFKAEIEKRVAKSKKSQKKAGKSS